MKAVLTLLLAGLAAALPGAAGAQDGWPQIAEVLRHPRCMNCHTLTEFPRQGDQRRRHAQMVMRGPQDHGLPVLPCSACHQDHNSPDGRVPGAPHWGLAPLSMGWEGLDDAQLCAALTDRQKNRGRDPEALARHMLEDALVQWAWAPGQGRALPTVSQPDFHAAVRRWVAAGARCPG